MLLRNRTCFEIVNQGNGTVLIPLTQGKFAIIDENDIPIISGYRWYAAKDKRTYYAITKMKPTSGMHRVIMGVTDDRQVDHINHNGLDNRRSNLRICTHLENTHNRERCKRNTSGYKNVVQSRLKSGNKGRWRARLCIGNGTRKHLGYFSTKEEAAKAVDDAAKLYHKDFAWLNDQN